MTQFSKMDTSLVSNSCDKAFAALINYRFTKTAYVEWHYGVCLIAGPLLFCEAHYWPTT